MRKRYYVIVLLLIIGHVLTEMHTALYWLHPEFEFFDVSSWFICPPKYVTNLNILWYSKMLEDSLVLVALLLAGAAQGYSRMYTTYMEWQRYSFRIYVIWCIYFGYHCFDMAMFFYNYKTSYWLYIIVLSVVTFMALFVAFFRHRRNP